MAALLFLPAGTLNYWQGWVFFALFFVASNAIGVYLAIYNPVLLERRMSVGPTAEKETSQKIITFFTLLGFIALLVFPALRVVSGSSVCIRCRRCSGRARIFIDIYRNSSK